MKSLVKQVKQVEQAVQAQVPPVKDQEAKDQKAKEQIKSVPAPLGPPGMRQLSKSNKNNDLLNKALVCTKDDKPVRDWPEFLRNIFVISMRPERITVLKQKMQSWFKHVTVVKSVDGRIINKRLLVEQGLITLKTANGTITRGRIGCQLSHCQVYQYIVDNKLDYGIVCEDDSDLCYSNATIDHLEEVQKELQELGLWPPEFMYLEHCQKYFKGPAKYMVSNRTYKPTGCMCLYMYYVTYDCAKKLLKLLRPMEPVPIDIKIAQLCDNGTIDALAIMPQLGLQRPTSSDTSSIK